MLNTTLSMSERLACRAVGLARSTYRHLPVAQTPADPDAEMRAWAANATKHPCHGFRRAWAASRYDERREVNKKKVHRLWREEGLASAGAQPDASGPGRPRSRWCFADAPNVVLVIDFQIDSTASMARRSRSPSTIHEHTRCSLLHLVERSITAECLVAELEAGQFAGGGGLLKVLRMEMCPELVPQALQRFCDGKVGLLRTSPPGCPWSIGDRESFQQPTREGRP